MASSMPVDGTLSRLLRDASVSQVVGGVVVIIIVRWFARAIYRVTFHPLAKFPGPKLHAATRIPQIISTWKGKPHDRLSAIHEKYGPVARVAPDEVSFIDPQAWKDIHGHGTRGTRGSVPTKYWERYSKPVNDSPSLLIARDADHSRMRRIFNPAFSDRALKEQEPLFTKYVRLLVDKLSEREDNNPVREFDMVRMYNCCTFDVMGDLTFGEPLHMLDNVEYSPWVKVIFDFIKYIARLGTINFYPLLAKVFWALVSSSFGKKRQEHHNFSRDRVGKRLSEGRESEGVDLWDLVLRQPEGKGLTRDEMDSNAGFFMVAGTETTATLASGMTYFLLKNPRTMQELTKEVREAFDSPEDMNIERVAALPYLNACIKESFRMYPPVALGLPRLTPPDGSTVCGQYIPPGWVVTVPQLAMYTSELNFKEPKSFIPERWLGDERFVRVRVSYPNPNPKKKPLNCKLKAVY